MPFASQMPHAHSGELSCKLFDANVWTGKSYKTARAVCVQVTTCIYSHDTSDDDDAVVTGPSVS